MVLEGFVTLSTDTAFQVMRPLFLFVIGMAIYAIFIFRFYKFVATKDVFELNLQQYSAASWGWLKQILSLLLYTLEYLIIFPIFVMLWFGVFALLLVMLSDQSIEFILLIAMAIVAAVRATAYYDEDLSKDLSKMLPFALLAVFIVDISYFSLAKIPETIFLLPEYLDLMLYYLMFTVILEFLLRSLYAIISMFKTEENEEEPGPLLEEDLV